MRSTAAVTRGSVMMRRLPWTLLGSNPTARDASRHGHFLPGCDRGAHRDEGWPGRVRHSGELDHHRDDQRRYDERPRSRGARCCIIAVYVLGEVAEVRELQYLHARIRALSAGASLTAVCPPRCACAAGA